MQHQRIPFQNTKQFSGIFLDYIAQKTVLEPFYSHFPTVANVIPSMAAREQFPIEVRQLLVSELHKQYASLAAAPTVQIELLAQKNTYTVCTGHQLNLFSGPLFFHYKIQTVIKTCQILQKAYPDCHFIPIYWLASEDHDFEEIKSFHLFGQTYTWESTQKGATGAYHTATIEPILSALGEKAGVFGQAYAQHSTLAEATTAYTHALYGAQGLLVLDANRAAFKAVFANTLALELKEQFSAKALAQSSKELEKAGYEAQVKGREINLFYMSEGVRERIVLEQGRYNVLNTNLSFSETEILEHLKAFPERFSPNVVLRTVYQESILPNLAYCGGPGEIAYWLQFKAVFDALKLPFPILLPRQFALYLSPSIKERWQKLGFEPLAVFEDAKLLKEQLLKNITTNDLSLEEEAKTIEAVLEASREKIEKTDASLLGVLEAEKNKFLKALENLEKRLKKSEEQKHGVSLKQLEQVLAKLFPNGSLQERHNNILNITLNKPSYLKEFYELLEPFEFQFLILWD
ncbi:MAG: bacillithiol biosynthesis cysteine-adding enzyme BshC [Cytophagales bacterium]|nr:MAG: bacillithiol biosynthesis cysteine-adding enzyme BshC [Cytophagales bacterium]TAF60314.1 MAG: bacillithiol biosynthesis cysteine-adding enzyme BshC [Cytophagales bacterium]